MLSGVAIRMAMMEITSEPLSRGTKPKKSCHELLVSQLVPKKKARMTLKKDTGLSAFHALS